MKKPLPLVWVWVFMDKGMGIVKNTHGLPMQNTSKEGIDAGSQKRDER
jgi:hypothetical protein